MSPHVAAAARRAVAEIQPGMIVGLGTGHTADQMIDILGTRYRAGGLTGIHGVPTSERSAARAAAWGLPLLPWHDRGDIDIALDGADEVDHDLNLLKGRGGALLREKHVARRARRVVVVIDHHKLVDRLGSLGPLPVEVDPAHWFELAARLVALGGAARLRGDPDLPYLTDNGNTILDLAFPQGIAAPHVLAAALDADPAVRAHGLFLGMTHTVIVAGPTSVYELWPYGEPLGPLAGMP